MSIRLKYGQRQLAEFGADPSRTVAHHPAPSAPADFAAELATALNCPVDFPPLAKCVVPGDKVVLAVDRGTPRSPEIVSAVWNILSEQGIEAADVTILQPASAGNGVHVDPRSALPEAVRAHMEWEIHDPADDRQRAYLATTAGGERIYLARELVEADFVLSIGRIAFDPVLGYRGTSSVFYPGLSSIDAWKRAQGEGHSELSPDDERPFRQLVDEVAWLLGTQFCVQVIAAGGDQVLSVLSGALDSVFRRGKQLLQESWRFDVPQRVELVIAAVESDSGGHGWEQVGAALANARRLVESRGTIVILSELAAEPGEGLELIRHSPDPGDVSRQLRELCPADLVPALQVSNTVDWADVYLLSRLPEDVVEDLHMIPLDDEQRIARLIEDANSFIFVEGAQHVYGSLNC